MTWNLSSILCGKENDVDDDVEIPEERNLREIAEVAKYFHDQSKPVEECRNYIRQHFRLDNLCFYQCRAIDEYSYKKGGGFWVEAYDFPKEDDAIHDDEKNFLGLAYKVGIFTFDIGTLHSSFDS